MNVFWSQKTGFPPHAGLLTVRTFVLYVDVCPLVELYRWYVGFTPKSAFEMCSPSDAVVVTAVCVTSVELSPSTLAPLSSLFVIGVASTAFCERTMDSFICFACKNW